MIDLRKHEAFGPLEEPSRAGFNNLSLSMHDPVPVANATERAQLVTDLTAAGFSPTTARPLYVYRADARAGFELEVSTNGTAFRSVNMTNRDGTTQNLIQSGSTVVTMGGIRASVTYPTPFTSSVSSVVVSSGDVVAGGLVSVAVHQFSSGNLTNFVFQAYNSSGTAITSGPIRVNWIAVGY